MKRNSAWCAVLVFSFAIGISAQTSFANVPGPGCLMWKLTAWQGTTRTGTLALRDGGRSSYSFGQVVPIAANLSIAFAGGPPTTFARGHLVNGVSLSRATAQSG